MKKVSNKFMVYLSGSLPEEDRKRARIYTIQQHTGKDCVLLDEPVSDELKEAHYNIARGAHGLGIFAEFKVGQLPTTKVVGL